MQIGYARVSTQAQLFDLQLDALRQAGCERAKADPTLANTYWRIVRLSDEAVTVVEGGREPHLLLREDGKHTRHNATVGYNPMQGGYAVGGDRLSFTPAATTLLPCPHPLDATERKLGKVMARASRWRIKGSTLELFDDTSASVALFKAIYLQ